MSELLGLSSTVMGLLSIVALARGRLWFLKSRKHAVFALIGSFVFFVVAIAIPSSAPAPAATPTSQRSKSPAAAQTTIEPTASKEALEVLEVHPVSEEFARYAAGTVRNNSNRTYGYVQVEINLYDKDGSQVGSTLANVNNLEPGATWKFKAIIIEEAATRFEVKDVTGF